jgi:hypothetical protein
VKRIVLVLSLLLKGGAWSGTTDAPPSLAIIPGDGERTPSDAVVATLEAALSAEKEQR